jgi:hypothetical protein
MPRYRLSGVHWVGIPASPVHSGVTPTGWTCEAVSDRTNRSVGVVGTVTDYTTGTYTKVAFDFWHHGTFLNRQTRSATSDTEGFAFVEPGPVGGITIIDVYLCEGATNCMLIEILDRP